MKFYTSKTPYKAKGLRCATPAFNPVQKQYKSICDINNIVKRAFAGDSTVFRAARCVDLENAPESLHAALQSQVYARNAYLALPDAVRAKYTTPEAYFAALHNPDEVGNLKELGIVQSVDDSPVKVEVTNPVTSEGTEA